MKKLIIFIAFVSIFAMSCTTIGPVAATSHPVDSITKVGVSRATFLFGIPLSRDASIETAAKNGGINNISIVDAKVTNVLWIFTTLKTTVKGY